MDSMQSMHTQIFLFRMGESMVWHFYAMPAMVAVEAEFKAKLHYEISYSIS